MTKYKKNIMDHENGSSVLVVERSGQQLPGVWQVYGPVTAAFRDLATVAVVSDLLFVSAIRDHPTMHVYSYFSF